MSRVLRRPMFRGGYVDSEGTGITSGLIDNYNQGGRVGFKKGKGVFDFFSPEVVTDEERQTRSDIFPYQSRNVEELLNLLPLGRARTISRISPLPILKDAGKYGSKPDFYTGVSGQAQRTLDDAPFLSNQYFRETLRPYVSGATETLKQAGTGIKDFAKKYGVITGIGGAGGAAIYGGLGDEKKQDQNNIEDPNQKEIDPNLQAIMDENKKLQELLYNKRQTEQTKESDTDVMNRYMEMFKANLAGDKDELKSQRYFELAKFGLNLLSQPGGPPGGKRDLLGAVGRAGVPAIEGLSRISAEEKAAERQAKILGFQAALRELENPALKKIQTLSKLTGIPESEIAKRELSESGQSELNRLKKIDSIKEVIESNNPQNQLSIAQIIVGMGKDMKDFKKQDNPRIKTGDEIKGQYYYFANPKPGDSLVGRWNGKEFLVPGDTGF